MLLLRAYTVFGAMRRNYSPKLRVVAADHPKFHGIGAVLANIQTRLYN